MEGRDSLDKRGMDDRMKIKQSYDSSMIAGSKNGDDVNRGSKNNDIHVPNWLAMNKKKLGFKIKNAGGVDESTIIDGSTEQKLTIHEMTGFNGTKITHDLYDSINNGALKAKEKVMLINHENAEVVK